MIKSSRRLMFLVFFVSALIPRTGLAEEPLNLEKSVEIALKNSITLNIAKEGYNGAFAQKEEAFTGFLPKFSTSYSYTRLNEAPFSRFENVPPPLSSLNGNDIPVGTQDNYNWQIDVKQPLFAGGGILANYEASVIGENVARVEETAKYQDVVEQVSIAYFNILRAQKVLDVARQSVEMLQAHRDVAENFFKVGMIPKNDLLHAEVELANGKQSQVNAQNAVELAKSSFNTVLKRSISTPVDIMDTLVYHPLNRSFEDCVNAASQTRPELKISSLKAAQAGKLVDVAKSEYFPTLSVEGNYARFGDQASVSGSLYKDAESWYVMAVANWNFWEWGKTKYRVAAGKAKENQAREATRELNDQVTLEIKNAYLNLQEAETQISVSKKLIEQAEENFRISEERYKVGIGTSTEVLDAQTLLTRAKSQYANALGDYNISYAKLERAMGTISAVAPTGKAETGGTGSMESVHKENIQISRQDNAEAAEKANMETDSVIILKGGDLYRSEEALDEM